MIGSFMSNIFCLLNYRPLKTADPMANEQPTGTATLQVVDQGHVQICKQSQLLLFFRSLPFRIQSDLRKHKTTKSLATTHFAKQVPKRKIRRFGVHSGLL